MNTEKNNRRFMNVTEVADVMGISKSLAYNYVKSAECQFTVVTINSRILIPENAFYQWYNNLGNTNNI